MAKEKTNGAVKSARQDRLPGMADAKIQALHNAAMDYADIRDQRQALTKQEVDLKQKLITLMHSHKKEVYDYNGVHIELIVEEETVKVRVKSPEDAEKAETKAAKKPDKRTEFNPPQEQAMES